MSTSPVRRRRVTVSTPGRVNGIAACVPLSLTRHPRLEIFFINPAPRKAPGAASVPSRPCPYCMGEPIMDTVCGSASRGQCVLSYVATSAAGMEPEPASRLGARDSPSRRLRTGRAERLRRNRDELLDSSLLWPLDDDMCLGTHRGRSRTHTAGGTV